jgi:hypothetical protein
VQRIVVDALLHLEVSERFARISRFVNVGRHASIYSLNRASAWSFAE